MSLGGENSSLKQMCPGGQGLSVVLLNVNMEMTDANNTTMHTKDLRRELRHQNKHSSVPPEEQVCFNVKNMCSSMHTFLYVQNS